ncbi:hypothetical protein N0V88_004152 [Collariella sp. IMI 366227]|nr:hypothetical protein N0V88_004152 [Collariella sp. IMI 366227]
MARLRLSLLIPLLSLAPSLILSLYQGYDYGFDAQGHVKRQLASNRASLVDRKDIHMRLEIRQLEKDQDLWTLYLLALSMMQYTDQSSPISYYSLAGIHGEPHHTWGGVEPVPGNENTGYCTHSSVLFPTWHRPYLALYEQTLQGLAVTIAGFWPEKERQRYLDAARRFRIPYWDWAATPPAGQSAFPDSIGGNSFVDVNGPSGVQRIGNPLYSYSFRPLDTSAFRSTPWNYWTRTLRSPSGSGPDAQSNNSMVRLNMDLNRPSIAQRLYTMFSSYSNYTTFSNNAMGQQFDSLESIHDTIHTIIGGIDSHAPGHMAYVPWSAFDPIFFLHHCMVDRVFAIWQALNPDAWISPTRAVLNSYTTYQGDMQTSNTPLTPFFSSDNGTFWTSDSVRDLTKFGYTYPELMRSTSSARVKARTAKQAVNRLYGSFSPANLFLKGLHAQGSGQKSPGKVAARSDPVPVREARIFNGGHYHEWIVNVQVGKQALDGTFAVHFFLGCPPTDPEAWTSSPEHVGTMGVFSMGKDDQDDGEEGRYGDGGKQEHKQQQQKNHAHEVPVSGTVPLTAALVKKVMAGELASLEPEEVGPYLEQKLEKRVLGPEGQVWDVGCVGE